MPLLPDATELAYIIHRGDQKDPGPDQYLDLANDGYEVWQLQNANVADPYILPVSQADVDFDADGVPDSSDNCTEVENADQRDTDNDGYGNACDADIAVPGDCHVNFKDLAVLKNAFFSTPGSGWWNPDADLNGDNVVNLTDLALMRVLFFGTPGPSGLSGACDPDPA